MLVAVFILVYLGVAEKGHVRVVRALDVMRRGHSLSAHKVTPALVGKCCDVPFCSTNVLSISPNQLHNVLYPFNPPSSDFPPSKL